MTIVLDGQSLTVDKLPRIASCGERVELHPDAVERIKVCRRMLEEKVSAHEIMYGVNTGIGEFSEVVLSDEEVQHFQKYLIYNHAAGIGEPAPIEDVRAAMAGRINVHAHGNSGCRPEITLTLVEMLNKGVTPVVCQKGSVGASGDLAPMSQIALLLVGEGEAFYRGQRLPGREAMERAASRYRSASPYRPQQDERTRQVGPDFRGCRRDGWKPGIIRCERCRISGCHRIRQNAWGQNPNAAQLIRSSSHSKKRTDIV